MKGLLRKGGVALGFAVGALFLFLTLRKLDWTIVGTALANAHFAWLLLAVGLCALAFAMRMERWRWMLTSIGSTADLRQLVAPFLGSFALNNILPLRAGDVVRAAAFRKQLGVPPSGATATLLVERVFDLYALLVLGAIALWLSPGVLAGVGEGLKVSAFVALGGILLALTLLLTLPRSFARLGLTILEHPLGRWIPRKLGRFGVRTLIRISHVVRRVGPTRMILMSLAAWAVEGGVFFCTVQSLGLVAETGGPWLALTAGNLGALLPGPPGHFGTFHFLAANALSSAGPAFDQAVLATAMGHFLIWASVTTTGLAALVLSGGGGPILALRPDRGARKEPPLA